jgi:hypothetical protein
MKYSLLCNRHPEYDGRLYKRYQALYEGGKLFKDSAREFLHPGPTDPPQVYDLRIRESSYRSYVGPIIDFFASQLFSAPYAIRTNLETLDEFYSQFKEDVDLAGTDLTAFMKHRFIEALIKGKSYWLAEKPALDLQPQDREEWAQLAQQGLDWVKLSSISTDCVIDWECNEYGDYEWLITHDKSCRRVSPTAGREIMTETWKVYDIDKVSVYQIRYTKRQPPRPDDIIPLVESYQHGFNKVPVMKLCLPEGLWLLNRAASAQIEHFRLSSALGWSLRKSAYAVGIFKLKDDRKIANSAGQGIILGTEEDFKFAEPTGACFDILQKEIEHQKDEIYRITNQMAQAADNSSHSLGRSGQSKQADQASTEIILHAYSDIVKEAIEKTYELISDARGDVDLHFSIEGMNKFYLQDTASLIESAKAAKDLQIASPTFYQELDYRVTEATLPWDTSQEVKDQIRKEIFAAPNLAKVKDDEPEKDNTHSDDSKSNDSE